MTEEVPRTEAANVGFPADAKLTPWPEARQALEQATTYWVGTVRGDGRPHVAPVWCVWLDGALYFSTGERSVKARNLAREPRCVMSVEGKLHLVMEGTTERVADEAEMQRMVDAYSPKYNWRMEVRDGAIHDQDGNAGPVYRLSPQRVLAFDLSSGFTATRFVF
ncbi:MAG TPA: pyridoxamine 5'-phosphate oxidase family protein [Dehalococcoidia bacterium]|jgi:PPOX class probable F420-dependent enzyme